MSVRYSVLAEHSLVLVKAWGAVPADVLMRAQLSMRAEPSLRPDFKQLMDLREVTEPGLSADEMRTVVTRQPFLPHARRAIVAANEVTFGLGRMYELLTAAGDGSLRVFRDLDAALAHLELTAMRDEVLEALAQLGPSVG